MNEESSTGKYYREVTYSYLWKGIYLLPQLPTLFFWGNFVVLSILFFLNGVGALGIIDSHILWLFAGELLTVFFAPFDWLWSLITHHSFSMHGGALLLMGSVSTWIFILGCIRALFRKLIMKTVILPVPNVWSVYKRTMRRVFWIFGICLLINLGTGEFKAALVYTGFIISISPFSLGIALNDWVEQIQLKNRNVFKSTNTILSV